MAPGVATAIAAILMILVLCSQGKPAVAIPCNQCVAHCGSSSMAVSSTKGPCDGVCAKVECASCKRKADQSCQDRCCGRHPACPRRCDCSDVVEVSCDGICAPSYSQACRDCRQSCVADCKTNCLPS